MIPIEARRYPKLVLALGGNALIRPGRRALWKNSAAFAQLRPVAEKFAFRTHLSRGLSKMILSRKIKAPRPGKPGG